MVKFPNLLKNRGNHLFEVAVIFVSVMAAFIAEDWREERRDRQDFNEILLEIEANLRLDYLDYAGDVTDVQHTLRGIDSLLSNHTLHGDSIAKYFSYTLFYAWPDCYCIGIEQLRNSNSHESIYDILIPALNNYYGYIDFLREIAPTRFTQQAENMRDFLISKNLASPGMLKVGYEKLSDTDIQAYREVLNDPELISRLKHMRTILKYQLRYHDYIAQLAANLLKTFERIRKDEFTIGLIGSATDMGWSQEFPDVALDRTGPNTWEKVVTLKNGELKFRADNMSLLDWGSANFPKGVGTKPGLNIPVNAGTYLVKFNHKTGEYSFTVKEYL